MAVNATYIFLKTINYGLRILTFWIYAFLGVKFCFCQIDRGFQSDFWFLKFQSSFRSDTAILANIFAWSYKIQLLDFLGQLSNSGTSQIRVLIWAGSPKFKIWVIKILPPKWLNFGIRIFHHNFGFSQRRGGLWVESWGRFESRRFLGLIVKVRHRLVHLKIWLLLEVLVILNLLKFFNRGHKHLIIIKIIGNLDLI